MIFPYPDFFFGDLSYSHSLIVSYPISVFVHQRCSDIFLSMKAVWRRALTVMAWLCDGRDVSQVSDFYALIGHSG